MTRNTKPVDKKAERRTVLGMAFAVTTGGIASLLWPASKAHAHGTDRISLADLRSLGDVKHCLQNADHSGWVLLDGRNVTTLNASQMNSANQLGFMNTLPDASNCYLSQNMQSPGSVSGSNQTVISQNQLPDVTLTTNNSGDHSHEIVTATHDASSPASQGWPQAGHRGFRTTDRAQISTSGSGSQLIAFGGAHSHTTSSINGGGSQQPMTISPKTLSVNVFVFLGP